MTGVSMHLGTIGWIIVSFAYKFFLLSLSVGN